MNFQKTNDLSRLTVFFNAQANSAITIIKAVMAKHQLNIHHISDQLDSSHDYQVIKALITGQPYDSVTLQAELKDIARQHHIDICWQPAEQLGREYRLACFDMDSTLIKAEVIDELAKHAGVGQEVAEITGRAMRGELDFKQSFRARMALLEGLSEQVLDQVASELPIMEGADLLFRGLKKRGIATAILSGGFNYFAEFLQQRWGIDSVHANRLEIVNNTLSGKVVEPIIDGVHKAQLLTRLAAQLGINAQQAIAVGDGANDLPMLSLAGLGVAFHAKPLVRDQAEFALSVPGLDGLLELIDN